MDSARFDAVLDAIASHGNARRALRDLDVNPGEFYPLIRDDDELAKRYARAKQSGMEALADEIIEIADDGRNDTYTDDNGNEREATDIVARSKLRVDSRKWLLSKLVPKVYGDKLELDAKVSVGDAIVERLAKARKPEAE